MLGLCLFKLIFPSTGGGVVTSYLDAISAHVIVDFSFYRWRGRDIYPELHVLSFRLIFPSTGGGVVTAAEALYQYQ